MKSLFTVLSVFLAVGFLAVTGGPAWAALIAYDGFATTNPPSDYLNGSAGSPNSTGFGAAWTAATGTTGFLLTGTSLPLPINNLGTEGGSVRHLSPSGTGVAPSATRPLTTSLAANSGDTWYFSAEVAPNKVVPENPNNKPWGGFGLTASAPLASNSKLVWTGFSWYTTDPIGIDFLLRIVDGAGTSQNVRANFTLDFEPHFYVAKVATHADGSVDAYAKLYANTDTLPTTEPATWDLHVTATGLTGVSYSYAFLHGRSYVNSVGGEGNKYDELRIGTTWRDVVAIPEPSALVLLACGLLGLLAYAWRKRK